MPKFEFSITVEAEDLMTAEIMVDDILMDEFDKARSVISMLEAKEVI